MTGGAFRGPSFFLVVIRFNDKLEERGRRYTTINRRETYSGNWGAGIPQACLSDISDFNPRTIRAVSGFEEKET